MAATAQTAVLPAPGTIIELERLTKTFGFRPVLRGLDLRAERGECVGLLGANGSGKTTLLRILAGLSRPSGGIARIGGWRLPQETRRIRPHIGYLGHLPLLYADLTAAENLRFFAQLYGTVNDSAACIATALDQVGLARRANDRVGTFSRGMQQRLGLARALLHEPDILLLDEPYTGLDTGGAGLLDQIISEQRAAGRTIILTSHDLDRTLRLTDRLVILHRGVIARDSASAALTPEELAALYAEVVGTAAP